MFDRLDSLWSSLPFWAKVALVVFTLLLVDAIIMAWGERHFVAAVAEFLVAAFLYHAVPIAVFGIGIFVGVRATEWTERQLFGWLSGIAATIAMLFLSSLLTDNIPGVSWRVKAMRDSNCYVDWDGRSNPTVCE